MLLRGAAAGALLLGAVVVIRVGPPAFGGEEFEAEPCSFAVCESAGCGDEAPNVCVATGGCSATPWTKSLCSGESCSLEACDEQKPDGVDSCKGGKCESERCASKLGRCGDTQPYQCQGGSSGGGCSNDEYGWVAVDDVICSGCCDTRSCNN